MPLAVKKTIPTSLAEDLIWGVRGENGIAAEIGRTESQTYYLIARGRVPATKLGHRTFVASRAELRRWASAVNS